MSTTSTTTAVSSSARDEPEAVRAGRARIDELDTALVALVRERVEVSRAIQQARMATGGPQVVNAREGEVVDRWRTALGAPGGRIALALLELSRGPAPHIRDL
jgi:chorismate mutase